MYDPGTLYSEPILPNMSVGIKRAEHPKVTSEKTAIAMGHPADKVKKSK